MAEIRKQIRPGRRFRAGSLNSRLCLLLVYRFIDYRKQCDRVLLKCLRPVCSGSPVWCGVVVCIDGEALRLLITCACRELPGGSWRLTGPTDSLLSVVGSPDKARQRRLRGSARTTCKTVLSSDHEDERLCLLIRRCRCLAGGADKPVKHSFRIFLFLDIFIA